MFVTNEIHEINTRIDTREVETLHFVVGSELRWCNRKTTFMILLPLNDIFKKFRIIFGIYREIDTAWIYV